MDRRKIQILLNIIILVLSFLSLLIPSAIFSVLIFIVAVLLLVLWREDTEEEIEEPEESPSLEETPSEEISPNEEKTISFPANFDEREFAKDMFLLYRDIQTNFMNLEYEKLQKQLGIELYEQFSKQMKHLEDSGRQSVRKNIDLKKIQIMSFEQTKDQDRAVINLSVLEDKYMKKMEEPFRLTSARVRYESCYTLIFIKHHRKKIFRKCSYCSEKLQGNPTFCPSCNHMLLESSENWILKDLKLVCSHSYSESKKES